MLAAYQAAARERGGFNTFGFDQMNNLQLAEVAIWGFLLAIPLLWHLPHVVRQLHSRAWTTAAASLLPWVAVVVAIYALATNGEFREAEWAILIAAGGVVAFSSSTSRPSVRRVYIALLCATTVSNLYFGLTRARVYTIGPHLFFEWSDHDHLVASGFLKNMRISSTLVNTEHDVALARNNNAGPFFFGPRLEFNYAAFHLPSPTGLPAWWHPGTSFARAEEPRLVQAWQNHHFETLIFLKGDYTYYPPRPAKHDPHSLSAGRSLPLHHRLSPPFHHSPRTPTSHRSTPLVPAPPANPSCYPHPSACAQNPLCPQAIKPSFPASSPPRTPPRSSSASSSAPASFSSRAR